ncbi:hypothetical protein ACIBO2_26205 [Nonomuraea sp. NPDC050022]|uniref:hypothetical protein n=1 Tax=Nonomuraea sp. NPDC050022 TaxID=3364358 RepID=UPI0037AD9206
MMGILTRGTPVERAFADLDKARETVARWQAEQAAKRAELSDLESRIGAEVLDDESAAERLADQAVKLRAQIDVAARTERAATDRVTDAGRAVLRAYAGEQQANADRLRSQVEQRQAKTDAMLKAVSEWEGGVSYTPVTPSSLEVQGAGQSGVSYKIPLTVALRNQMTGLEAKARQYEGYADAPAEQVAEQVERLAGRLHTPAPATVAG